MKERKETREKIVTSPPTATDIPLVATALGLNFGFVSKTFWFDRITSISFTSATKTDESSATATDFGWDAVDKDTGL